MSKAACLQGDEGYGTCADDGSGQKFCQFVYPGLCPCGRFGIGDQGIHGAAFKVLARPGNGGFLLFDPLELGIGQRGKFFFAQKGFQFAPKGIERIVPQFKELQGCFVQFRLSESSSLSYFLWR